MSSAEPLPATWSAASPAEIVTAAGAEDLFVLRRVGGDRFAHLGGTGRGAGWAGIVEIAEHELFGPDSNGDCVTRRVAADASHVFGPYYARGAAVVRVTHDVVVVFGGATAVEGTDGELLELGRFVAHDLVEVEAAKRLADELEVLTALQELLQSPPETLTDALQRLADHATQALSCELGVAYLSEPDELAVCDLRDGASADRDALRAAVLEVAARGELPRCVQQTEVDDLPAPVSAADGVVAYYVLELKHPSPGVLLLLHTTSAAPRGFTQLCQALGAQLAAAAEPLLAAAALRDRMRSDLDRAHREARVDQLTGLANRLAWDEAIAAAAPCEACPAGIVMIDGGGLKSINDTYGHQVGDEVLCLIAGVLRSCVREDDITARLGGDEFGVLLREADERLLADVVARIEQTTAQVRLDNGLGIEIAVGAAVDGSGDLAEAQRVADARMLEAKRSRRRPVGATPLG